VTDVQSIRGRIAFTKHIWKPDRPEAEISSVLGIEGIPASFSINLSEGSMARPDWQLTPFHEKFKRGRLPNETKLSGVTNDGVIHAALHVPMTIQPGKKQRMTLAMALGSSYEDASQNIGIALKSGPVEQLSTALWQEYFSKVPYFECSDEYLTRYYWYRWYGLRLNTIQASEGNYSHPFVCEGIDYFRAPISYSAPCHMLENAWMHTPELAQGSLMTFLDNQREDGGFRGYIDPHFYRQEMFYHGNWGDSIAQLHCCHPSVEFLNATYNGLKKYAQYFDRERDEEVSGMYDIDNHYETGQEYMHRYTIVSPNADQDNWGEVFRLKGVDVTIYVYQLKRALAGIAATLGKSDDAELWKIEAEKTKKSVLQNMWDPDHEMFYDVDPATGQRTCAKAATCFYPYFTDIVSEIHLAGLKRHLLNQREFWTPYPIPSTSADDETFSAEAEWKGKRMNCPWNGRVWPMTNSHIAEALAQTALRFDDRELKKKAAAFITGFVRMMFFDGDATKPNCFEHYNPMTGQPGVYRGIDDYQHSWVNDLIIKYLCGIQTRDDEIRIEPLPFGLSHILIDDVIVRGKRIRVEIDNGRFTVWTNGTSPVNHRNIQIGKCLTLAL
jgi:hypothetical protein